MKRTSSTAKSTKTTRSTTGKKSRLNSTLWKIKATRPALDALAELPAGVRTRVHDAVRQLAQNPLEGRSVKKLRGSPNRYRLRVGEYRVIYEADQENRLIKIERVRHRRDAYRR